MLTEGKFLLKMKERIELKCLQVQQRNKYSWKEKRKKRERSIKKRKTQNDYACSKIFIASAVSKLFVL